MHNICILNGSIGQVVGKSKRVAAILDYLLLKRPDEDLARFCVALEKTNQRHIVDRYFDPLLSSDYVIPTRVKPSMPGTVRVRPCIMYISGSQPFWLKGNFSVCKSNAGQLTTGGGGVVMRNFRNHKCQNTRYALLQKLTTVGEVQMEICRLPTS